MTETATKRYLAAVHAMQSGVEAEMGLSDLMTSPKHLRVGVNCAMVENGGLAGLLIAKGLITRDEYLDAIATAMAEEVRRYEDRLSEMFGRDITLG